MPRPNDHGLKVCDQVIVLTCQYKTGKKRRLYRYDTGADWAKVGLFTDKIEFQVTYEPWDGIEEVSFYNGD